jgi:hypothetical protein
MAAQSAATAPKMTPGARTGEVVSAAPVATKPAEAAPVAAAAPTTDPTKKASLFAAGFDPTANAGTTRATADTERRHRSTKAPTRPGAERAK